MIGTCGSIPRRVIGAARRELAAADGVRVVAKRCSCPSPLLDSDFDSFTLCLLCGRQPSIRLPASARASESASTAMNANGAAGSGMAGVRLSLASSRE
jgi:hypothetical protein